MFNPNLKENRGGRGATLDELQILADEIPDARWQGIIFGLATRLFPNKTIRTKLATASEEEVVQFGDGIDQSWGYKTES
jgi:hypothetical protein